MPFNLVNEIFGERYWLLIFLVALMILLWFISKDFKVRKKYLNTLAMESTVSMKEIVTSATDEGIMLLDMKLQLVGANAAFYSYTGLTERTSSHGNLKAFAKVFPNSLRRNALGQLKKMFHNGAGWMNTTIYDAQGIASFITISVYSIYDGEETIAYYLSLSPRSEPLHVNKSS